MLSHPTNVSYVINFSCIISLIKIVSFFFVNVVPLNSQNYPLWGIINGTETPSDTSQADNYAKFVNRRDQVLAIIVWTVDPSLMYL